MKVAELLLELTTAQAAEVFRQFGYDAAGDLKAARRALMQQYHPDHGGDVGVAKLINTAYDVLTIAKSSVKQPVANPRPTYADTNWYGGRGRGNDTTEKHNSRYDRYR